MEQRRRRRVARPVATLCCSLGAVIASLGLVPLAAHAAKSEIRPAGWPPLTVGAWRSGCRNTEGCMVWPTNYRSAQTRFTRERARLVRNAVPPAVAPTLTQPTSACAPAAGVCCSRIGAARWLSRSLVPPRRVHWTHAWGRWRCGLARGAHSIARGGATPLILPELAVAIMARRVRWTHSRGPRCGGGLARCFRL